jgi:hypothetical protein
MVPVNYVIARYNEDTSWSEGLNNVIIYNKGQDTIPNEHKKLPNVGREGHTILSYIIEFYDNLPDIVVFTQGEFSYHYSFHKNDKETPKKILKNLAQSALIHGISDNFTFKLHYDVLIMDTNNWPVKIDPHLEYLKVTNVRNGTWMSFLDWFKMIFKNPFPNPAITCWNAIFAVRKDIILKQPLEYYKNLIAHLDYDINPIEGYYIERSWYYIFNSELL